MRVIDHVGVGVNNFETSVDFYSRALAPLGIEEVAVTDSDNRAAGFGSEGRDDFWINEGRPAGRAHIAFGAAGPAAAAAFPPAAIEAGGRDNGAPGLRPEYSTTYYAAYVLDPNGNNIEAVFHGDAPSAKGHLPR